MYPPLPDAHAVPVPPRSCRRESRRPARRRIPVQESRPRGLNRAPIPWAGLCCSTGPRWQSPPGRPALGPTGPRCERCLGDPIHPAERAPRGLGNLAHPAALQLRGLGNPIHPAALQPRGLGARDPHSLRASPSPGCGGLHPRSRCAPVGSRRFPLAATSVPHKQGSRTVSVHGEIRLPERDREKWGGEERSPGPRRPPRRPRARSRDA